MWLALRAACGCANRLSCRLVTACSRQPHTAPNGLKAPSSTATVPRIALRFIRATNYSGHHESEFGVGCGRLEPCVSGMKRPSVQGCIYSVFETAAHDTKRIEAPNATPGQFSILRQFILEVFQQVQR